MKKIFVLFMIFVSVILVPNSLYAGNDKKVKSHKDNIYLQKYRLPSGGVSFLYLVDVDTQLCYAVFYTANGTGMTLIPAKNLKNRPEWKDIITWE